MIRLAVNDSGFKVTDDYDQISVKTNAVDQFVAREAHGCKAEGFSRQKRFYPVNSNEELSAIGVASPTRVNPHHVSERLVETDMENAPQSSQGT